MSNLEKLDITSGFPRSGDAFHARLKPTPFIKLWPAAVSR